MLTVRLKKYEQGLLCEVWPTMPQAIRAQLTQKSVRDIELSPTHATEAVDAISKQHATCGCGARSRRLDTLLAALRSPL